jgi:general secretion pathway protein E
MPAENKDTEQPQFTEHDLQRPVHVHLAQTLIASLKQKPDEQIEGQPSEAAAALISDAIRERATDIHLDPETHGLRVRLRIDGVMRDAAVLTSEQGDRLVNQFKSLAGIDPVAQFSANQSRFSFSIQNRAVDIRLGLIPCLDGEKLTLRILEPVRVQYRLEELGLSPQAHESIKHWFASMGGMFLVAGPVASGKTTTLYSLLQDLKLTDRTVITLEDPVEYSIQGVTQIQVDAEHDLTFPAGLVALARHDPDVVLVGEMRDAESVEAAYGTVSLGRTVLATIHARDAVGTITALRYYGLEDHQIAAALSVVVAQRLVRKLCTHCREPVSLNDKQRQWFELAHRPVPEHCWIPGECEHCSYSGYFGRTGVFEVWRLTHADENFLVESPTEAQLRESLKAGGHRTMLENALQRAQEGTTSLEEVQRLRLPGALAAGDCSCE